MTSLLGWVLEVDRPGGALRGRCVGAAVGGGFVTVLLEQEDGEVLIALVSASSPDRLRILHAEGRKVAA